MTVLKPCPFCGGEAENWGVHAFGALRDYIKCTKCSAASPQYGVDSITAWNTRALTNQPKGNQ